MSALRHRYRITVDGVPHDILTSARDMAGMDFGGVEGELNPMQIWGLLHAACMRLEVPGVPHDLDKFIDLLDEIEDLEPATPAEVTVNPTG